jgi:hypothetical protein
MGGHCDGFKVERGLEAGLKDPQVLVLYCPVPATQENPARSGGTVGRSVAGERKRDRGNITACCYFELLPLRPNLSLVRASQRFLFDSFWNGNKSKPNPARVSQEKAASSMGLRETTLIAVGSRSHTRPPLTYGVLCWLHDATAASSRAVTILGSTIASRLQFIYSGAAATRRPGCCQEYHKLRRVLWLLASGSPD